MLIKETFYLRFFRFILIGTLVSLVASTAISISDCTENLTTTDTCGDSGETAAVYCIRDKVLYSLQESNSDTCISKFTLIEGINILEINGNSISTINFTSFDFTNDLSKVVIVNCNDSKCSQTYGIIKDENDTYYYIKSDNNAAAGTISDTGCSSSNVGLLIKQTVNGAANTIVLCLSESKFIPITSTAGSYLMDTTGTGAPMTVASNKYGVVTVSANYFVLDNLYTSKSLI